MKVLILGSNRKIEEDRIAQHIPEEDFGKNIEKVYLDLYGGDITWNINKIPYPFEKNTFGGVFTSHCLEHADPQKLISILNEIHRISSKGSKIVIYVPHFSSPTAHQHITHYKCFGVQSFNPLCDNIPGFERYIKNKFDIGKIKVNFSKRLRFLNKMPPKWYSKWENGLSTFLPAHEIKFELIVKK